MNPLKPLTTPEYFYRPRQIVHRFKRAWRRSPLSEHVTVTLPWGSPLRIRPKEVIGSGIWCYGVFDLTVTEAICRLLDPAETALDIGANIGQMTTLMRYKAGRGGRVIAFEPHPGVFSELKHNVEELAAPADCAAVQLYDLALSDVAAEARLFVGPDWALNQGLAKILRGDQESSGSIAIKTARLDEVVGEQIKIGVCKIDVEGHELEVLKGAAGLLEKRRIRDIIFEDPNIYPSKVHAPLLKYGFTIFSLHSRLWGPRLCPAAAKTPFMQMKDGCNYVASLDPERAIGRFRRGGWQSLRPSNPSRQ